MEMENIDVDEKGWKKGWLWLEMNPKLVHVHTPT